MNTGGYPTQGMAYPPQQHTYPPQQNMAYPQQPIIQQQGMAYPQQAVGYPPRPQAYPPQQGYPPPTGPPPPYAVTSIPHQQTYPPSSYPMAQGPYPPTISAHPSVRASGSFDQSARFGHGASYNIPPAPPGVAPTHAQIASMQGQNVYMQHQKSDWVTGPPGGGSTFW